MSEKRTFQKNQILKCSIWLFIGVNIRLNAVLERFAENLPAIPYATDDFKDGQYKISHSEAVAFRYIQHNRNNKITYLAFDIDHKRSLMPAAAFAANDACLPEPTIKTLNPGNGKGHLLYELECPVTINSDHPKPYMYAGAIEYAYMLALASDASYNGATTKNPLCDYWRVATNDRAYTLAELAEAVTLPKFKGKRITSEYSQLGRNCMLFENCRQYAYQRWSHHGNYRSFYEEVLMYCEQFNLQFEGGPLGLNEVKGVAKSAAKWVWTRFSEKQFVQIQRRRGIKSGKVRRQSGEQKVLDAIRSIFDDGAKLTKAEVARRTGMRADYIGKQYAHFFKT